VKKMTPEGLRLMLWKVGQTLPNGAQRLAAHISALESELTAARDAALEEAAEIARTWRGLRDTLPAGEYEDAGERMARRIRALKCKPAQEVLCEHGSGEGVECTTCHPPAELASEENGLLPKKRRCPATKHGAHVTSLEAAEGWRCIHCHAEVMP
jgi:hypothetical protein